MLISVTPRAVARCTCAAHQNQITSFLHETATGQLPDLLLIQGRIGPLEALQITVNGKLRHMQLVTHGARLALRIFRVDQTLQLDFRRLELAQPLGAHCRQRRRHAVEM